MTPSIDLYLFGGAALFAIGLRGLIGARHLLRRIMGFNIMSSGVFLVLIGTAARTPGDAPDPIPHAMVLTGIVVSVCATGLGLVFANRVQELSGRPELSAKDDHE